MFHLPCRAALAVAIALAAVGSHAQTPATTPDAPAATPAVPAPDKLPDAAAGLEQVAADQVVGVLGVAVHADGGAELGRIVDVLVNAAGEPRAAIVDVGGFLGVGNRKVAVAWRALHISLGKTPFAALPVPPERIKSAPAYDPTKPVEVVEAPPYPAPGP